MHVPGVQRCWYLISIKKFNFYSHFSLLLQLKSKLVLQNLIQVLISMSSQDFFFARLRYQDLYEFLQNQLCFSDHTCQQSVTFSSQKNPNTFQPILVGQPIFAVKNFSKLFVSYCPGCNFTISTQFECLKENTDLQTLAAYVGENPPLNNGKLSHSLRV